MPDQQTIKITQLTDVDIQQLQTQRALVEKYLTDDASRQKYQTTAGKLALIQTLLQEKAFNGDQTYELRCLGVVLGDALVQDQKLEWIMVDDPWGHDAAVRVPGTSITISAVTMIAKRVERGEKVDVANLFKGVIAALDKTRRNPEYNRSTN